MKRRSRILLAALLVVVLGGLVLLAIPSGPPDPVYDGHPVSWWVRHPDKMKFYEGWMYPVPARVASPKMDSNAVPYLITALQAKDGPLHNAYAMVWQKMPPAVQSPLPKPAQPVAVARLTALLLLGGMDRDAAPAIPAVMQMLKENKDSEARYLAVLVLGHIGTNDKRVTEALVEPTHDKEPKVREAARMSLKQLDPEAAATAGVK